MIKERQTCETYQQAYARSKTVIEGRSTAQTCAETGVILMLVPALALVSIYRLALLVFAMTALAKARCSYDDFAYRAARQLQASEPILTSRCRVEHEIRHISIEYVFV